MQKEIFEELLAKMEDHCENVLIGSEIDYRRHIALSSSDQARTCNLQSYDWCIIFDYVIIFYSNK